MSSDLIIGRLDEEYQEHIFELCKGLDLKGWSPFGTPLLPGETTAISVFNVTSYSLFNDYVAGLEGITQQDAIAKSRFRHITWWLESVWLPIDFHPPKEPPPSETFGEFVGSSVRLLDELTMIRDMSTIDIAQIPSSYHDMRNDYEKWLKGDGAPLSNDDVIRWIWNALHEGASISVDKRLAMMLGP